MSWKTGRKPKKMTHKKDKAIAPKREETGDLTRLEGRNPLAEALAAGRSINRVYLLEGARQGRAGQDLADLAEACRQQGALITYVSRAQLDAMAESHGHQGIIAEVAPYDYQDLDQILAACRLEGRPAFFLILDQIQDAYNLGSILRVADGAGVDAVVIPKHRAVPLNAAVAKASAGAVEHVPLCRVTNLTQTILSLKEEGFWIYGTAAGEGMTYKEADYSGNIAVVIGSEGFGVARKLAGHCDYQVSIPLKGKVNSLNAAVACAIICFEASSQRPPVAPGSPA